MRVRGMVQMSLDRSISSQVAPRTSPLLAAVRTRKRNASFRAGPGAGVPYDGKRVGDLLVRQGSLVSGPLSVASPVRECGAGGVEGIVGPIALGNGEFEDGRQPMLELDGGFALRVSHLAQHGDAVRAGDRVDAQPHDRRGVRARFGAEVTILQQAPHLLMREDADVIELMQRQFVAEGIRVLTGHRAERVESGEAGQALICAREDSKVRVPFDAILVAAGRQPNTEGLGLEDVGVTLDERGEVEVDEYLRTSVPTIYACSDAIGPYQFTHTASHEAWYASVNSLFGPFKRFKADYSLIP